ncbi:Protein O-glucosyltransferase 2 [Gryganskiella cystojenkinii]|nr:Protein O-glucosyltransferase 2 [Gryganskiella cystojenkinii]
MRISAAIALVSLAASGVAHASDVIQLTKDTWKELISPDQKIAMVDFYAPWCGHCKTLEPEYEKAAKELKKSDIPLIKVDCTEDMELCKDFEVSGYPTLKIFKNGIARDYKGTRKSDGIISYIKRHSGPPVKEVTPETLPEFSQSERVVVVAVLPKGSPMHEEVEKIANYYLDDFLFGEVETHPDVKAPAIVLYKQFDEGKTILEGDFTERSLVTFVRANCIPMLDEMGPRNYAHYMDAGLPLAYLFFGNQDQMNEYKSDLLEFAQEMKGQVNFVTVDGSRFGAHAGNVGLKDDWPGFALQDVHTADKYPLELTEGEKLTIEKMREHTLKILNEDLRLKLKSEAVPENQDGPVTIVVAHNYKEIVENNTDKDVLIEYYAPWCGFCKMLAPVYDELGELYKGSNIVIAKIDHTANDLPISVPFQVDGYPTFKFKKAGSKDYMDYEGQRTKEDFVDFLNKHAINKFDTGVVKAPRSEAIPESQDGPVTILVGKNYKEIVEENADKDVLIKYYAPWCGFCKELAPLYDELGELYKGSNIVIAKIDATLNELPSSVPFKISGYPTIKFKKAGSDEYIDYSGQRTKVDFVDFLNKNAKNKVDVGIVKDVKSEAIPESQDGPVTIVVAKNHEAIVEQTEKDVLIEYYAPWCGFCKQLAPIYDELGELYKGTNIVIAKMDVVANELPSSLPFKVEGFPTIKFKKAGTDEYIEYHGERTKEDFVEFLNKNAKHKVDTGIKKKMKSESVPISQDGPVMIVVTDNHKEIVEQEEKDVLIEYYAPWCGFCKQLAPIFDEVGELYKGSNIVIAKMDVTANELPSSLPFKVEGYPTIKFKKAGTDEYIEYHGERSKEDIVDFLNKNAKHKVDTGIKKKMKSEAVPASQDGPVTVVVADNYKDIVEQEEKDVLIEYYAPWCGFCTHLAPIYNELGDMYKGTKIVIAKFDATANDLPSSVPFKVEGFPTIKFKKAGSNEYIDYQGERTKDAFVEFLNKNAKNKVTVANKTGGQPVPAVGHDEL